MEYKYGHFSENGNEFIITDPATPRVFDNFLWNDTIFSNAEQTGVGYCDYQIEDKEAVQLLTGNGRICDFDIFGRDTLMSRLIYVRDRESRTYWNVNWEPVCAGYESYQCIHGLGYTEITSQTDKIKSSFRIFVPDGIDPVELWSVKTKNTDSKKRNITLFIYNQFQFRYKWGFDSYGDMLFRSSDFNKELNAVIVSKHPHIRPHNYLTGYLTADRKAVAFDGTREAFTGKYHTLSEPEAVVNGHCTNTPGSSDATVGVLQFDLELAPGEEKEISLILGVADEVEKINDYKEKYFGHYEEYFNQLQLKKQSYIEKMSVKTPDRHLNRIFNGWLKEQCLFEARWVRWGWNGYRDIVQHGLGVVNIQSERTRQILKEALYYQYKSGLALRGWNPPDTKLYSDSALWLVFTLTAYLKETLDLGFLDEEVDFYDEGRASVFIHIKNALDFLEEHKGSHGLCLIKFGDWNDSLTAVGKNGRGESVWLSEAYAQALKEMSELVRYLGKKDLAEQYKNRYDLIKEAVNKEAWDGEWYARCFDDNGVGVGTKSCSEGKIFSESQGWAMISGIADKEKTEKLLASCDKYLATDQGYKLLAPTFTKFDPRIGRISSMEPGICENGTIYTHTNIWLILGMLKSGYTQKAWECFKKLTPGYLTGKDDRKNLCPPYVYANCYFGPDHKNNAYQMEYTWITGSVAWINYVLGTYVFGVRAEYDGLVIDPHIPAEWKEYQVTREFRGAVYEITFIKNSSGSRGDISVKADGITCEGNRITDFADGRRHKVIVDIG